MNQFICNRCVMDRTAEEIQFTDTGCNFCDTALKHKPDLHWRDIVSKLRKPGEEYDVLLGLSGGVDSSFALHTLVELGIKPLTYSIDNGWQSDKAQENIMKLVEGLKVPYFRQTIDKEEFLDLQMAFMKAGQKNIEIPSDHILLASTYDMAEQYNIKHIITGGNWATESIMPESWGYQPRDLVHIKDIYRRITGKSIKNLPTISLWRWNYFRWIDKKEVIPLLDYVDYNRQKAIQTLTEKYGYEPYGEKHCESLFTWWFQNYYLFEKFGIDKRKAHLSSEIISGQITRDEALYELEKNPVYPNIFENSPGLQERIMAYPKRPYTDFKTDEKLYNAIRNVVKYATV